MTISAQDREWIGRRGDLTAAEEQACDRLCNASFDELNDAGLNPRSDDRAAAFEAAVIRWLIQCRD